MKGGLLFDEAPIRWLQQLFGLEYPLPLEILSLLGDTWGILLALAVAFWLFGRREGHAVAAATAAAAVFWAGAASLVDGPRPSGPDIVVLDHLEAGGFPSGHVFQATAVWGVLVALTRLPLWLPILVGSLVGLGRLYMGAHYPGDVLASLLIGPLFAWGVARGYRFAAPRLANVSRRRWVWILVATGVLSLAIFALPFNPGRLRRWEVAGIAVAGPLALAAQLVWLRSGEVRVASRLLLVAGFVGIVALALVSRMLGDQRAWVSGAATAAAVAWIIMVIPRIGGSTGSGRGRRAVVWPAAPRT